MSRAHPVLTPIAVAAGAVTVLALGLRASGGFTAMQAFDAATRRIVPVPAHRVDLETASAAELALLPEVGPGMAAAIVADRAVRGPFRGIDALARVPGIGRLRLEAIRPHARTSEARDPRGAATP